jgi:hypothetical protein
MRKHFILWDNYSFGVDAFDSSIVDVSQTETKNGTVYYYSSNAPTLLIVTLFASLNGTDFANATVLAGGVSGDGEVAFTYGPFTYIKIRYVTISQPTVGGVTLALD